MNTPSRQTEEAGIASGLTKQAQARVPAAAWEHYTLGRQHGLVIGRWSARAENLQAMQGEKVEQRVQRWQGHAAAMLFGLVIGAGCMFAVMRQWGVQ